MSIKLPHRDDEPAAPTLPYASGPPRNGDGHETGPPATTSIEERRDEESPAQPPNKGGVHTPGPHDQPPLTSVEPLHTDERAAPSITSGPPEAPLLPLTPEARRMVRRVARLLLVLGALYGICWLLWSTASALTPFVIGLVLAYLLLPVVNRLNQHMPRWAAILIVYVVGVAAAVAAISFLVPPLVDQIRQLVTSIPSVEAIQERSNVLLEQYRRTVPVEIQQPLDRGVGQALQVIQSNLTTYVQNLGTFLLNSVLQVFNTLAFLFGFLIIPFWLFYVLNDQQAGMRAIDSLLPRIVRDDFWAITRIIDNIFRKYIAGQLFLGLVVGSLAGIGLFILRLFGIEVPYILLLAILAALTELIPVVGPVIGAIPAIVLALFTDSPVTAALIVTALYIGIQQVENQFLVPRIIGESVGIHPAVLMVLLVVCSQAFGLIGAILAAPASAAVRDLFNYLYLRLSEPAMEH